MCIFNKLVRRVIKVKSIMGSYRTCTVRNCVNTASIKVIDVTTFVTTFVSIIKID
jgi:hypothetical protein